MSLKNCDCTSSVDIFFKKFHMVLNYLSKTLCDKQLKLPIVMCKVKMCILPNIHKCASLHLTKLHQSPEEILSVVCVHVCMRVKKLLEC